MKNWFNSARRWNWAAAIERWWGGFLLAFWSRNAWTRLAPRRRLRIIEGDSLPLRMLHACMPYVITRLAGVVPQLRSHALYKYTLTERVYAACAGAGRAEHTPQRRRCHPIVLAANVTMLARGMVIIAFAEHEPGAAELQLEHSKP